MLLTHRDILPAMARREIFHDQALGFEKPGLTAEFPQAIALFADTDQLIVEGIALFSQARQFFANVDQLIIESLAFSAQAEIIALPADTDELSMESVALFLQPIEPSAQIGLLPVGIRYLAGFWRGVLGRQGRFRMKHAAF
jgi:hypothetical protein